MILYFIHKTDGGQMGAAGKKRNKKEDLCPLSHLD